MIGALIGSDTIATDRAAAAKALLLAAVSVMLYVCSIGPVIRMFHRPGVNHVGLMDGLRFGFTSRAGLADANADAAARLSTARELFYCYRHRAAVAVLWSTTSLLAAVFVGNAAAYATGRLVSVMAFAVLATTAMAVLIIGLEGPIVAQLVPGHAL